MVLHLIPNVAVNRAGPCRPGPAWHKPALVPFSSATVSADQQMGRMAHLTASESLPVYFRPPYRLFNNRTCPA